LELAAADTNRVGRMMLSITDAANHVPVFHELFVLPQAIYDWLTGVIVPLPANMTTIAGAAVSASTAQLGVNLVNIAGSAVSASTAQLGVNLVNIAGAAVSTSTAQLGVNAVQAGATAWGSGAITAGSIASNAIAAAKIATGAITSAKFAAGAIDAAAIANAAIDFATFAADCKTGTGLKANVESVTADAITAAAIANGAIDNATFAADVGSTAYATNIIALAADKAIVNAALGTAAELAKVPKSDSTVTWNATALASINAEVDTALNTAIPGSPTADSINERVVAIDAYGAPPSAASVAALVLVTPAQKLVTDANGYVTYSNTAPPAASVIADAVWDEVVTVGAHDTATFAGKQLLDAGGAGTPPTVGEIADAVWDEAINAGHATANTAGKILYDNLNASVSTLDTAVDAIATTIGVAGAGLTACTTAVGFATPTNITAGTITTVTNLTNLPAAAALEATLTAIKGATFAGATDSLEAIRDRGDAAWATATGFATPTNITAGTITTVTNLTNAPANGDLTAAMKSSVTAAVPTVANIADGVWDEVVTTGAHDTATFAGKQLLSANNGAPIAASAIADAVWDEVVTTGAHDTATFAGKQLLDAGGAGTPPTKEEIADAVWNEVLHTDHEVSGSASVLLQGVDTDVDTILADTGELQTNQGNWLTATGFATPTNITAGTITTVSGNVTGSVGSVSGDTKQTADVATLVTAVATIDTVVDAIKLKTDSLTFTVSGKIDSNIKAVKDLTIGGAGTEFDPWGPA
jgi:hypothetical protein